MSKSKKLIKKLEEAVKSHKDNLKVENLIFVTDVSYGPYVATIGSGENESKSTPTLIGPLNVFLGDVIKMRPKMLNKCLKNYARIALLDKETGRLYKYSVVLGEIAKVQSESITRVYGAMNGFYMEDVRGNKYYSSLYSSTLPVLLDGDIDVRYIGVGGYQPSNILVACSNDDLNKLGLLKEGKAVTECVYDSIYMLGHDLYMASVNKEDFTKDCILLNSEGEILEFEDPEVHDNTFKGIVGIDIYDDGRHSSEWRRRYERFVGLRSNDGTMRLIDIITGDLVLKNLINITLSFDSITGIDKSTGHVLSYHPMNLRLIENKTLGIRVLSVNEAPYMQNYTGMVPLIVEDLFLKNTININDFKSDLSTSDYRAIISLLQRLSAGSYTVSNLINLLDSMKLKCSIRVMSNIISFSEYLNLAELVDRDKVIELISKMYGVDKHKVLRTESIPTLSIDSDIREIEAWSRKIASTYNVDIELQIEDTRKEDRLINNVDGTITANIHKHYEFNPNSFGLTGISNIFEGIGVI